MDIIWLTSQQIAKWVKSTHTGHITAGHTVSFIERFEAGIRADRLLLTPMMASHAKIMFPVLSDRTLYGFTGDEPPASSTDLETRYRKLESRQSPDQSQWWLNWLVTVAEGDTPIGYVQATVCETHTDVAWVIGVKWQGNGYASEAAAAMLKWLLANDVTVIRACIHPGHVASQRVASKLGLCKSNLLEDGEDVWVLYWCNTADR